LYYLKPPCCVCKCRIDKASVWFCPVYSKMYCMAWFCYHIWWCVLCWCVVLCYSCIAYITITSCRQVDELVILCWCYICVISVQHGCSFRICAWTGCVYWCSISCWWSWCWWQCASWCCFCNCQGIWCLSRPVISSICYITDDWNSAWICCICFWSSIVFIMLHTAKV